MTRDLENKLVVKATFDRAIDRDEGLEIAKAIESKFQETDPEARMAETWLDVQQDQTIVFVAFPATDKLREAMSPMPEGDWPVSGEVMSFTHPDTKDTMH